MEIITSKQNSLVKSLRKLVDSKRARTASQKTISEGIHLLEIQLSVGVVPELVVLAQRCMTDSAILKLLEGSPGSRVVVLTDSVFDSIAPADTPLGLLAISQQIMPVSNPIQTIDTLVLDRVQDPGNVGSLIRTAVAAGIRQVILSPGCADAWSPRCLRAGQGAQWVASIFADTDLSDFIGSYQGAVAATVLSDGNNLYEQDFSRATAWLFGNEGQGVDLLYVNYATHRVTIPMPGNMESLNVNAAAAVCLFEQVRQRSKIKK